MATQKQAFKEQQSRIPDDATFMPASEWRKVREEGIPVLLPISRRLVRLRTVKPDHLLLRGDIPDTLADLVVSMLYGLSKPKELEAFLAPKQEVAEALKMLEGLRHVCEAALVYPRVVAEPLAADEIRIDDLEVADRGFIFRLVFLPADALAPFRYQPQSDVEPMADGAGDAQPRV